MNEGSNVNECDLVHVRKCDCCWMHPSWHCLSYMYAHMCMYIIQVHVMYYRFDGEGL